MTFLHQLISAKQGDKIPTMGRVDYGTLALIKRCKSDNFSGQRAIFQV